MVLYTIMCIYEVPAKDRIEATDRMLEALELSVKQDYHVNDIVRAPEYTPGTETRLSFNPPRSWLTILGAAARQHTLGFSQQG